MRVVVVGLLPRQAEVVRRAFPGADLLFIGTDEVVPAGADFVCLRIRSVRHGQTGAAFAKYRRDRVRLVPGGVTSMLESIRGCLS